MEAIQHTALQRFVDRLASRSILTEPEEQAILGLPGEIVNVRSHGDFVKLGQNVQHSCLVVAGLVGRFGQNSNGERQITCIHIAGDMADLPSVVCPKAGWGLNALTPTTIMRISHTDLRRIAAAHSGIAEALWRDCVVDGSIFSEWVVNVGRREAIARIAHVFCEMAIRSERAKLGTLHAFPLPITQADLADATGLTSVHVNRTLTKLRTRGVASLKAGVVTIKDWDQLVTIGDFDDAFMLLDGPCPRLSN